jgi:hypothetical protein
VSLSHEVTVWCDGDENDCGQWEQASGLTAKNMRRWLKKKGWTHKKGQDLCPRCSENERRRSDEQTK